MTFGKPFHVRKWEGYQHRKPARFAFDEITEILMIQDNEGQVLMFLEDEEEIEAFFKRTLEIKKILKEHPSYILG